MIYQKYDIIGSMEWVVGGYEYKGGGRRGFCFCGIGYLRNEYLRNLSFSNTSVNDNTMIAMNIQPSAPRMKMKG